MNFLHFFVFRFKKKLWTTTMGTTSFSFSLQTKDWKKKVPTSQIRVSSSHASSPTPRRVGSGCPHHSHRKKLQKTSGKNGNQQNDTGQGWKDLVCYQLETKQRAFCPFLSYLKEKKHERMRQSCCAAEDRYSKTSKTPEAIQQRLAAWQVCRATINFLLT